MIPPKPLSALSISPRTSNGRAKSSGDVDKAKRTSEVADLDTAELDTAELDTAFDNELDTRLDTRLDTKLDSKAKRKSRPFESSFQMAPVQMAPVQMAPVQMAPVQMAPVQMAPVLMAPVLMAPDGHTSERPAEPKGSGGVNALSLRLTQFAGSTPGQKGAMKLMKAMAGFGTDKKTIFETLANTTPAQRRSFQKAFKEQYGMTLESRLRDDMGGLQLQKALGVLRGDDLGKTMSHQGSYQAGAAYIDAVQGPLLKFAAFLSSKSWTRPIVSAMANKQLQLDGFNALDLSSSKPLDHVVLPPKPQQTPTSLDAILAMEGSSVSNATGEGPPQLTIEDLRGMYLSGETTPTEVAQKFLEAVKSDPTGAFVHVDEDALLGAAKASTERHAAGKPLSPLDGMPIGVKDQLDVKDMPSRIGTNFLGKAPAKEDAAVVANVRATGALIVGKTQMNELGFGVSGTNPHTGSARNPYDLERGAGGSSGGSGAALASGLVVAAIGSDAGGSTRIPAALNGVYGLKPTFDVYDAKGNFPLAPSVQSSGPMATTAKGLALMHAAMAGGANLDHFGETSLHDVTVGVCRPWSEHADPAIVEAHDKMVATLREQGATVVEVDIVDLNLSTHSQLSTYAEESLRSLGGDWRQQDYGADVEMNLEIASEIQSEVHTQGKRARARLTTSMDDAFQHCDVVLSPMTATTAPRIPKDDHGNENDANAALSLTRFTCVASQTGLPSLSLPGGFDDDGLPIGLQLMGQHHEDALLLRIANAVEGAREHRTPTQLVRLDG